MPLISNNPPAIANLLSLFSCPYCREGLTWSFSNSVCSLPDQGRAACSGCERSYPLKDGILDFLCGSTQNEVITPFQRLMQFPPLTAIYEKYWRPLGFLVASSSSFRKFSAGLIQRLEPQKRSSILDLACGPGLFACPLAAQTSGWVIGFDLSLPMLRRAHKKARYSETSKYPFRPRKRLQPSLPEQHPGCHSLQWRAASVQSARSRAGRNRTNAVAFRSLRVSDYSQTALLSRSRIVP